MPAVNSGEGSPHSSPSSHGEGFGRFSLLGSSAAAPKWRECIAGDTSPRIERDWNVKLKLLHAQLLPTRAGASWCAGVAVIGETAGQLVKEAQAGFDCAEQQAPTSEVMAPPS